VLMTVSTGRRSERGDGHRGVLSTEVMRSDRCSPKAHAAAVWRIGSSEEATPVTQVSHHGHLHRLFRAKEHRLVAFFYESDYNNSTSVFCRCYTPLSSAFDISK
jgi:hypothetical protein